MAAVKVALDWDGTLVDQDQNWLPGALDALRWLRKEGHKVIIHSARANWVEGLQQIESKLAQHKFSFKVIAKPEADLYVDDRAFHFERWPDVMKEVRSLKKRA